MARSRQLHGLGVGDVVRDKVEMRRVMMFNLSPPSIEMAGLLVGHLEKVLREDFAVVPADARLEGCATDSAKSECQDRANTIFGAITVSLEKEPMDGQFRQRNFRVKGSLRFQDRLLSSFDVTCKARAEARADIADDRSRGGGSLPRPGAKDHEKRLGNDGLKEERKRRMTMEEHGQKNRTTGSAGRCPVG
jgi:hypothetical protein